MKGQRSVISIVLITTVSVLLAIAYYLHMEGLYRSTESKLQKVIEEQTKLAEKYIKIQSALAKLESNSGAVQLMITMVNTGTTEIALYGGSVYVYKNDVLVYYTPIALSSDTCPNPLPPGASCIITVDVSAAEYSTPRDIYNSHLVMFVNKVRKIADIDYAGEIPGLPVYGECNTCESCSALLSRAPPESLILVSVAHQADGNCIKMSGIRDVTVYCRTAITGSKDGIGILIEDSNNITIRSCEVWNFQYGIYIKNSKQLSFSSMYVHDNSIDFGFDDSTLGDVCAIESARIVTTDGYIYFAKKMPSKAQVVGASAIWLVDVNGSVIDGVGNTLSRVSPAIALCNTSFVGVTSYVIKDTDIGIYLSGDRSTEINGLNVSASKGAVRSENSDAHIYDTIFNTQGYDVFSKPMMVKMTRVIFR